MTAARRVQTISGRRVNVEAEPGRSIEDAAEARYAARNVCRHRSGLPIALAGCRTCGGRANLPAYWCELHSVKCVELRRPVDAAIRWCLGGCNDHERAG